MPAKEKRALLDAVHTSLVDALKIPEDDRNQRLDEYAHDDFLVPPGRTDRYVLIEITMFPGRSLDARRNLYRLLVDRLAQLGIPETDIIIVLHEPPLHNWGIRGGQPASEVRLGFKLDV